MGVLAYIPILLLGLTSLIDESTQVARPQATLFSKPDIPFSHGDPNSYRLPTIVGYTAPERAYSLFFAEASPNDESTDVKSAYKAYLQSRLESKLNPIRISLPKDDPDTTLVEWLLSHSRRRRETNNEESKYDQKLSGNTNAHPESSFRKSENSLANGIGDLFKFNPITRERFKRDDDGRGIAFHQCYWNPVSCFR